MSFTFDATQAFDPTDPRIVAAKAEITFHAVGDVNLTPLEITDVTGVPLPNPYTTNDLGAMPAFVHETLDQVAWSGGGQSGKLTSWEGLRDAAGASRDAALAAETAAANAANLVGAPADTAIATAINGPGTQTHTALSAAYAALSHSHGAATSAADGFMSSEDKTKLDGQASEMIAAISAEVVRADAAYRPATNQLFEGASLYAYGHSWVMDSNPYISTGGEYQKRVKERLQLGTVAQNGLSGAYMLDMAAGVLAPSVAGKDRRFPMGGKGIVTLQCLINDIVTGNAIPSDATWLPFYKDNLRTFLAAVTAGKIQDASTGVYAVGTWADLSAGTADWYPAGKVKYVANATSLGATAKWDVSGDVAWVNAVAVATTTGATNGGNWTARVNGVVVGSYQPRGKKPDTVVTGTRGTWGDSPMAVKLTGLNAAAGTSGNKTITITCDEARTTYVAGVMEPSANPPKVFVVLEAPRNPAASNVSGWNTYAATYRQAIIDVVAEFPSAFTVDIAPGWQNPTFIGSKDTAKAHPNDLGMIHIADKLESAIRANITAPDPGVLVL